MGMILDTYESIWGAYKTPEEASTAATGETDRTLGAVISMLAELYLEKRAIRMQLEDETDDDVIGELGYQLKLIRSEESSLHRIESGLQSRLKTP